MLAWVFRLCKDALPSETLWKYICSGYAHKCLNCISWNQKALIWRFADFSGINMPIVSNFMAPVGRQSVSPYKSPTFSLVENTLHVHEAWSPFSVPALQRETRARPRTACQITYLAFNFSWGRGRAKEGIRSSGAAVTGVVNCQMGSLGTKLRSSARRGEALQPWTWQFVMQILWTQPRARNGADQKGTRHVFQDSNLTTKSNKSRTQARVRSWEIIYFIVSGGNSEATGNTHIWGIWEGVLAIERRDSQHSLLCRKT